MKKYVARVDRREFLNLPGHHYNATVNAYVEDTTERGFCDGKKGCGEWTKESHRPHGFEPKLIVEVSDCSNTIDLSFEIHNSHARQNSFHKIDTLISALQDFRQGLVEESALYRKREKAVAIADEEYEKDKGNNRGHSKFTGHLD